MIMGFVHINLDTHKLYIGIICHLLEKFSDLVTFIIKLVQVESKRITVRGEYGSSR